MTDNDTKLAPAMQAATTEIYLLDAETLRLVDVNQAARQNLGYGLEQLSGMTPFDLAPSLDAATFDTLLASLGQEIGAQVSLSTRFLRADGSRYPIKLCFLRIVRDGRSLFLAIGDDQSLAHAASAALQEYQARFTPWSTTCRAWSTSSCGIRTAARPFPT